MSNHLCADILSRAEALGLKARAVVEGLRVGDHKSPYRGFSIEFVQHRTYVPGDDIRHIDWKSYARSERYTIKQYEQETNFIAHLLIDASKSMEYGEGESNKLEYAKLLAATLSYLIVSQRDCVGLNVFDSQWRVRLPISSQMGHLQVITQTLESVQPEAKTGIAPLLKELAESFRKRGIIILISDCFDDVDSLLESIQHLRFLQHEVVLFHVMHNDELTFPFNGRARFDGLETSEEILTRPHQIRESYLRTVRTFLNNLRNGCESCGCDYVLLDTSHSLGDELAKYLAVRASQGT